MGRPAFHPKPDLSHFSSRELVIPSTRVGLERELLRWITDALNHTKHPHHIGGRQMPIEQALLFEAEGIDEIMEAPSSMALGSSGRKMTVDAKFYFEGRLSDGNWFVRHIKFTPRLSAMQKKFIQDSEEAEEQARKKRIWDEFEAKRQLLPIARAFPVEKYLNTYDSDIGRGKIVINRVIEAAYQGAREAAAIPDNPYSPRDVALSLAGGAPGEFGKAVSKGADALGKLEDLKKSSEGQDEKDLLKGTLQGGKTKGDQWVEKGIDLASNIPGVGPFVKGFAGMLFDFASANFAGEVTKVRCRAYLFFVAGFIQGLTLTVGKEMPKNGFDNHFYTLGYGRAQGLLPYERYQAQIYLLEYVRDGHWLPGQTEGIRNETRQDWTFPRDYIGHWSPELLAKALTAQLHQKRYLVD
jgi:hypothetical protein